jgi:hypothetical protein
LPACAQPLSRVPQASINPQEVDDLARQLGLVGVYRTSVKDNVNVTEGEHGSGWC